MRKTHNRRGFGPLAAALAFAACVAAAPAAAGGLYQEHVHADSFGNLIVYSPAGFKRILVGQGHLAEALKAAQAQAARPRHDGSEHGYEHEGRNRHYRGHCNRQPVLLHGRSYMYGLPDNVVPVPAGICY